MTHHSDLTVSVKRTRLIDWVRRRNSEVEPRKYDWQELFEQIKPWYDQCEPDKDYLFNLMCEATNYR